MTDLQIEIGGITLHVDVCDNPPAPGRDDGGTGWILRRVDLWDADRAEDEFGARWESDDEAYAWWDANDEALDAERKAWIHSEADDHRPLGLDL